MGKVISWSDGPAAPSATSPADSGQPLLKDSSNWVSAERTKITKIVFVIKN